LIEVSIRTIQGRFLLRPSAELNDLILGVIGRALSLYPAIKIYVFKFASNHFHMILAGPDARTVSRFMNHINSNIAREAGRLHDWHDRFWSRRHRQILFLDQESLVKKVRYIMSHGCKEGLVPGVLDWPGVSTDRALLYGQKLEGTWYDRTAFYRAERRGKDVRLEDYATRYEVPIEPLPFLEEESEEQRQEFYRCMKGEIERETWQRAVDEKRGFLGVRAVLEQDPHGKPRRSKRSRAPLCYASRRSVRKTYERLYRRFVSLYRQALERFERGEAGVKFPPGCFLPPVVCPEPMTYAMAPGG
jgi:REP element-mobilizing transposase RayT